MYVQLLYEQYLQWIQILPMPIAVLLQITN